LPEKKNIKIDDGIEGWKEGQRGRGGMEGGREGIN